MENYYWPEQVSPQDWHYTQSQDWHYTQSQVAASNEDMNSTTRSCMQLSLPPPDDADDTLLCQYMDGYSWSQFPTGVEEADRLTASASASKSHSQAEKRRRDRINAQLATLRNLLPKSDKMDKAALLGSAVEHLKELKKNALEISKHITIPTTIDEVTVTDEQVDSGTSTNNTMFIRVSICCDNRPELFRELNHAIESLRLKMIEADMSCLGGRIKSCFVVCRKDNECLNGIGNINTIKQSLRVALSRIVASSICSNYRAKSKRQRFFFAP